jgi:hypothetical protein
MNIQRDDRILPILRIISIVVLPFLLLAFQILYLSPENSGERFAWEIQPPMMAAFMGAGYLTGAYFFLNVIFGRQWHRMRVILPAIACFTFAMLAATILHWSRFDIRHAPFQAWLALYILVPPLVSYLWFRNDQADPRTPEPDDIPVPDKIRLLIRYIGMALTIVTVLGFIMPQLMIQVWPWELTPLTARVTCGWISLVAVGSLFLAAERRWSAWRMAMDVLVIWQGLILIGGLLHVQDLKNGLFNWLFISMLLQLIALIIFCTVMEVRRRKGIYAA